MENKRNFSEFIKEIRWSMTAAALKTIVYSAIVLPLLVIFFRWVQCNGWWGYEEPIKSQACVDLAYPLLYWINVVRELPKLFIGLPPILLGILYLEWDKYKKDKPSGFTHERGCEGHPGYTRRLKWVNADSWEIGKQAVPAVSLADRSKRYQGSFREQELLRSLRRKFARTENKPIEETESMIRWRIVQMNGREVHINLRREKIDPPTWVMTTKFFEWAGRKVPPILVETHTTEFVALGDSAADKAI